MEPCIQISEEGVSLVFPCTENKSDLARVFTPSLSINVKMPYACSEPKRVGVQIYRAMSPAHSVMLFDREVYVPELETLNVENCQVYLGDSTRIFFPRK